MEWAWWPVLQGQASRRVNSLLGTEDHRTQSDYPVFSLSAFCDLYLSHCPGFLDGCPKNRNGAKNIEIIRKQQYGVGKRTVFLYSSFYLRVGCIKEQVALTALVVYFLLGNSPACEVYMPTFRNTLFHLHR